MTRRQVFYLAFDHGNPSGGIKEAYRHVEILNRNGIDAYVLHDSENAGATWFDHSAPIVSGTKFSEIYDKALDVVVIPEDMTGRVNAFPGAKVIFNQNVFYGFASLGATPLTQYPYLDPGVKAVFCVSDHNAEVLHHAYPGLAVHRLSVGIDGEKFQFRAIADKSMRICFYIKKNPVHNLMFYHLARSRAVQKLGGLEDFEWIILDGRQSESDVSAALRDSLVFIFLSIEEGCPLMPLEAAASGTLPFVYDTGPASDWVPDECQFRYGDLIGMLDAVEAIAGDLPGDTARPQAVADEARERAARFSLRRREQTLMQAWRDVFDGLS